MRRSIYAVSANQIHQHEVEYMNDIDGNKVNLSYMRQLIHPPPIRGVGGLALARRGRNVRISPNRTSHRIVPVDQ
jgi:hypothetical protein